MRVSNWVAGGLVVVGMVASAGMRAESKNPADYPLRLQIFGRSQTSWYHSRLRELDETQGDGRADLYEGGEARGVDFRYECGYKVRPSFGYETYPARWKKPGKKLIVLLPQFGESGKFFTCEFDTDVKDFAYSRSRNGLRSEPVAQYKLWMQRHDYDPEHGKDTPVRASGDAVNPPPMPAAAQDEPAPQP